MIDRKLRQTRSTFDIYHSSYPFSGATYSFFSFALLYWVTPFGLGLQFFKSATVFKISPKSNFSSFIAVIIERTEDIKV